MINKMKIINKIIIFWAVIIFVFAACVQKKNTINTAGSTTILPIVQAAAEA